MSKMLLVLLSLFTVFGTDSSDCQTKLKPPVFFSYAWPIGPKTVRDFTTTDMDVINVIDIGPDSLSYPPSIRKHYPKEVFDRWHKRGIVLVRRCYDRPFGANNRKVETFTVAGKYRVSRWDFKEILWFGR